jgi:hypothetical protein
MRYRKIYRAHSDTWMMISLPGCLQRCSLSRWLPATGSGRRRSGDQGLAFTKIRIGLADLPLPRLTATDSAYGAAVADDGAPDAGSYGNHAGIQNSSPTAELVPTPVSRSCADSPGYDILPSCSTL